MIKNNNKKFSGINNIIKLFSLKPVYRFRIKDYKILINKRYNISYKLLSIIKHNINNPNFNYNNYSLGLFNYYITISK